MTGVQTCALPISEEILKIATANLHAVDIHPFAAFLTTLNVLFMLMPWYVKVRAKNPEFSLDLQVFSADSLEKRDKDLLSPELFVKLIRLVRQYVWRS